LELKVLSSLLLPPATPSAPGWSPIAETVSIALVLLRTMMY